MTVTALRLPLKQSIFILLISSPVLMLAAPPAQAYDDDTHFWLTYYLARKVGYTPA